MRSKAFLVTSVILIVVLIGFAVYFLYASSMITRDNAVIFETQTQLSSANSQVSSLENQLSTLNAQLSSANLQISSLQTEVSSVNSQISSLKQENAHLTEIITPTKATHNLSSVDYNVSSTYWNMSWGGREYELQQTTRQVNTSYYQWHTYIPNETDCNDMACDVWDMLRKQGVISLIVFGNLDSKSETWGKCNHTWLLISNNSGQCFALEPTNGQLYFKGDTQISQYLEGFFYAKPSDLRADLGSRW